MASRTMWRFCALIAVVALLTTATFAQAAFQTPKNGCISDVAYGGDESVPLPGTSLTSPSFTPTSPDPGVQPTIDLEGWFEVESVNPSHHDVVLLEYSTPTADFTEFGRMTPTVDPTGEAPDLSFSNRGLSAAPSYQPFTFSLPLVTRDMPGVRVRLRFASGS